MWAARAMRSEGTLSLWWLKAMRAMLQMLIYTWILQYSSTGVKCAFLYILLIVFSLDPVCCLKSPGDFTTATGGALRHDNECMCVCVFGFHLLIVCGCKSMCESFPQRHTGWILKRAKPTMRCLGWSYQQKHGFTVQLWGIKRSAEFKI